MLEWLTSISSATAISWWGGILSTILAALKIWELWSDRFRVQVDGTFAGIPEIGHRVHIQNLSPKPIIVKHWVIIYRYGFWPFHNDTPVIEKDYDENYVCIASFSTHSLDFRHEKYFDVNPKKLKNRSIYFRLHISGRRPLRYRLYPF